MGMKCRLETAGISAVQRNAEDHAEQNTEIFAENNTGKGSFMAEKTENKGDFRSDSCFLIGYFEEKDGSLLYRYDAERVWITPWGENALRIRAAKSAVLDPEDWALTVRTEYPCDARIEIGEYSAKIRNGKLTAVINNIGKISFYNQDGKLLLEEFLRNREDMFASTTSSLQIEAREFKPLIGGQYHLTMRFESDPAEKIYGMGQYQQDFLNLKGADLELAHRNSQKEKYEKSFREFFMDCPVDLPDIFSVKEFLALWSRIFEGYSFVHGDMSESNFVLVPDGRLFVLDYEFSMIACQEYDVGRIAASILLKTEQPFPWEEPVYLGVG